jgi:mitochondrial fission protein ELM1
MAMDAQSVEINIMKALILTDGKPGHENQSVALCKNLEIPYETVQTTYKSKSAKALTYLLDRIGIYTSSIFQLSEKDLPEADVIISTGSTTFYPNKVIAKRNGLPNVAILCPGGYRLDFSVIFSPEYDHPPTRENITLLPLNLCAADSSFYEATSAEFERVHTQNKPAAGFIIGGPNAVSEIDFKQLKTQLEQAFEQTEGYERWVTTSRRTPGDIEQLIESFPFDYTLINSRDPYNPVPAFIERCEHLFVTSDSASMISECATFGKASVNVLMTRQHKSPNKFEELILGLEAREALQRFDGTLSSANRKIDVTPLLRKGMQKIFDQANSELEN